MVESDERVVETLAECIVRKIEPSIRETVKKTVQEEVIAALKRALSDSEFYKGLNDDVMEGIGKIYKEIFLAKQEIQANKFLIDGALQTIDESQFILDNVLEITEMSTLKIMDVVEAIQDNIERARNIVEELRDSNKLNDLLKEIDRGLTEILTLLSFQDITGQKIKKLIESIKKIEEIAFELYLGSEIFKKAKAEGFGRSYEELREEVKKQIKIAKQKKPESIDQQAIDELLESLNL